MIGTEFYLKYSGGKPCQPQTFIDAVQVVKETKTRFVIFHHDKFLSFEKNGLKAYGDAYGTLLPITEETAKEAIGLSEVNRIIWLKSEIRSEVDERRADKFNNLSLEDLEEIYKIIRR